MAALRSGIRTVIIPKDNLSDLEEIDQTVRSSLEFVPVSVIDEAVDIALIPKKTESGASQTQLPKSLLDTVKQ